MVIPDVPQSNDAKPDFFHGLHCSAPFPPA